MAGTRPAMTMGKPMPNAFDFANPPFDRLVPQERETLRKALDIAYFRPGETVIASGVPVEAFYVVIKGFVEERAGEEPVALLGPKDSFDSRALVQGHAGNAFVAREETLCYVLPEAVARDLIRGQPALRFILLPGPVAQAGRHRARGRGQPRRRPDARAGVGPEAL